MQIQLNQSDIDLAVRQYITRMGITRDVDEIKFSTYRNDGSLSVKAEIELSDPDAPALTAVPSRPEPVEVPKEKPANEEKPDEDEVAETPEEKEEDESPFKEEPASKSIFG